MRWIVGDVQGCAQQLESLLERVRFDPAHDELWCAGDIVNRGPETLATLRLWRDVGGRGVLGNHEVYTLCAYTGTWPRKRDTLDELFAAEDAALHLERLRTLPVIVNFMATGKGPELWLVHAGLHPAWTDLRAVSEQVNCGPHDDAWLVSDDVSFCTRVRCCTAAGERSKYDEHPDGCPPPYAPWDDFYRGDALVVHGHWARRGHYRGRSTLGLDSGCVYGGPLTAYCHEEDRIVQVAGLRD